MTAEAIFQSQVIQKAWEDQEFKEKLLNDPKTAIREALGISLPENIKIKAVEETSDEFYLIIPPSPSVMAQSSLKPKKQWY